MSSYVKVKKGMTIWSPAMLFFAISMQVPWLLKICVAKVVLAKICQRGRLLGL